MNALMIEAASTSETSVNFFQTTQRNSYETMFLKQKECGGVRTVCITFLFTLH
jgi:hypothetical protein